jgi:hypothetical protein
MPKPMIIPQAKKQPTTINKQEHGTTKSQNG